MLSGIYALAKSIDNGKILRSARFNIYFTYIYFGLNILGIFDFVNMYYILTVLALTLIYFFKNLICIYRCFMQITYKGYDEELERKFEEKSQRRKNKNLK